MRRAYVIAVPLVSALLGIILYYGLFAKHPLRSGLMFTQPKVLSDFTLYDQFGAPFRPSHLLGHWTLLFAGYTSCPDVCPTTLAQLKYVWQTLDESQLHIAMVSVDPQYDTSERLKDYMAYFDPDFLGLRAEHNQLSPFLRQLGLIYTPKKNEQDMIHHSASMVLLNPEGQVAAILKPSPQSLGGMMTIKADDVIHDLKLLLHNRAKPTSFL
tara:strand:- start:1696 stop:2331 length:636 start_codon:yes stop_codon:yes gene_type:complete